ncbi:MAG: hypothetical protein RLP44_22260 [Aggregatilineales bacterium]
MSRFYWITAAFCTLLLSAGVIASQNTQSITQSSSLVLTATLTPSATIAYDPTLYAIRRVREMEIAASLGPTEHAVFMQTERAIIATYAGTIIPSPTPQPITAVPYTRTPCAWVWHTEYLPDLSDYVRIALRLMPELRPYRLSGYAEAFGENCVDSDGTLQYFAVMETDFTVAIQADELTLPETGDDLTDYGDVLLNVLIALSTFDTQSTPGGQAGRITIRFLHSVDAQNNEIVHTVRIADYDAVMLTLMTILDEDLRGADVVEALAEYMN